MVKLRDETSSTDLRAIHQLRNWTEGKATLTASQVREAAEQVVNWCDFVLGADVVKDKR